MGILAPTEIADIWKGIPGLPKSFEVPFFFVFRYLDIIGLLMPVLSCEWGHLLTIPGQGRRQGEVQILLTPGRLVRKSSNMQQCELLAELLPSGTPVGSIPICSGLQRLGASVPSDLHGWPDTSLSRGVVGVRDQIEITYPQFLIWARTYISPNKIDKFTPVALVTEGALAWPAWSPHFGLG